MKTTKLKTMAKAALTRLTKSLMSTITAIAAAIVADTATQLIHAEGAPGNG
jgi:hypothetical protein